MIVIASLTRDGIIGRGGELPWDLPEERQQLRSLVDRKVVLLGRKTYERHGADFHGAELLVVSRTRTTFDDPTLPAARIFPTLDDALRHGFGLAKPLVCAGGASLFEEMVPLADKLYLSYVTGDHPGDVRFPELVDDEWDEERRRPHERFEFVVLKRR